MRNILKINSGCDIGSTGRIYTDLASEFMKCEQEVFSCPLVYMCCDQCSESLKAGGTCDEKKQDDM